MSRSASRVDVQCLPNGYWQATIILPDGPEHQYTQTESSFHDEEEARGWAEMMIGFLTCTQGCCESWR